MSFNVEKLEGNLAKLTIEVDAAEVDKAITKAYQKIKNRIQLPGFRAGKVPQNMAEKHYGVEIFYEDAVNFMLNDSYPEALEQCDLEIVSQPEIDIVQIEKGKNFIYTATVAVKPEVTLGQYKGLEYTLLDSEVSEEDVQAALERELDKNSREVPVEDRAAQLDDIVSIDFDGYVDGKQFDGGKSENYSLTLGSHSFIDTFEDQIVGHNVGDEFDVNVTFPAEYGEKSLAGQPAVFKCKLNEIKTKELPELDDEFAAEVSEFDTLDEYKADIKAKMAERKADAAKKTAIDELVAKAVENAEMIIPDQMVNEQAEAMVRNVERSMQQQGFTMEQYLQMMGQTRDQFLAEARPHAYQTISSRLVLEAIAKQENLVASDEAIDEQVKKIADAYGMEFDKVKELLTDEEKEDMSLNIVCDMATDLLYDNGVGVEPKEEEPAEEAKDAE